MERIQKFEDLLDLEFMAKGAQASVELMPSNLPLYLKDARHKALAKARAELYAALGELSPVEMVQYGTYRLKALKAEEL